MNDFFIKKFIDLSISERQNCINDIYDIFKNNQGFDAPNFPKYQTYPNLFFRKQPHWQKLSEQFSYCVSEIYGNFKTMICWSYVSFVGKPSSWPAWHDHVIKDKINKAAIFYLQLEDTNSNGTFFDLGDVIVMPKVDLNCAYFFDPDILHTPSMWLHNTSTKDRIVLGIDVTF